MGRSGSVGARALLVALVTVVLALPPRAAAATTRGEEWTWPLRPVPVVVRGTALPVERWLPGHRGVDLRPVADAVVVAPLDGVVTFAGRVVDRGVMTIAHVGALRSSLEPVEPLVRRGDRVRAGEPVALLTPEGSHCAPTECLHWGVRRGETYLDPLALLRAPEPPVLLPQLTSRSLVRSCTTAFVCIWQMRDSVTPRIRPISASVRPS